jgi:hypothetical protein
LPKALREDKNLFLFALSHVGSDYVFSNLRNNCQEEGERWDEMGIIDVEYDLIWEIDKKSITEKAGKNLLKDREVIDKVLDSEPYSFCSVNTLFYSNREVALKAVSKVCYNYTYLSDELKQDKEIIKLALEANGIEVLWKDSDHWSSVKNYVIQYIPYAIMNDKSFCLEIINDTQKRFRAPEYFIKFCSDSIKDDKDFILELAETKPTIINHTSEILQNDPDILALKK